MAKYPVTINAEADTTLRDLALDALRKKGRFSAGCCASSSSYESAEPLTAADVEAYRRSGIIFDEPSK